MEVGGGGCSVAPVRVLLGVGRHPRHGVARRGVRHRARAHRRAGHRGHRPRHRDRGRGGGGQARLVWR